MKRTPRYQITRFTFKSKPYACFKSALKSVRFDLLTSIRSVLPFFRVKNGL